MMPQFVVALFFSTKYTPVFIPSIFVK